MKFLKILWKILQNKYFLWALIVVSVCGVFFLRGCQKEQYDEQLSTYKRQLEGQL